MHSSVGKDGQKKQMKNKRNLGIYGFGDSGLNVKNQKICGTFLLEQLNLKLHCILLQL